MTCSVCAATKGAKINARARAGAAVVDAREALARIPKKGAEMIREMAAERLRQAESDYPCRASGGRGGDPVNQKQYERWMDFATRMARACYGHRKIPSGAWIEERVRGFVEARWADYASIHDWDDLETHVDDALSPDFWDVLHDRIERRMCDLFGRLCQERDIAPSEVDELYDALLAEADSVLDSPRLLKLAAALTERWRRIFLDPVECCVRAGLDMASAPSAGVVGFTVGDLRRMYPEGIPRWVTRRFKGGLAKAADGVGVWL